MICLLASYRRIEGRKASLLYYWGSQQYPDRGVVGTGINRNDIINF
jgi:hypothetical protein